MFLKCSLYVFFSTNVEDISYLHGCLVEHQRPAAGVSCSSRVQQREKNMKRQKQTGFLSVVVGHGSQSMLGRVVGRAQLQQAFVLCGSQGMTNFNFKKAENRYIRHFVRLRFPSHRYLTSND